MFNIFSMSSLNEIIPDSNLLDDELSAIRGGDPFIAICRVGQQGDLKCDTGEIPIFGQQDDIDACS